jgi:hypothetical protein
VCTALARDLDSRRSAQRFERDTYHEDAPPTELRGQVLTCLTWGFVPHGGQLGLTALLPLWRLHLEAPNLSPGTIRAYPDDGTLRRTPAAGRIACPAGCLSRQTVQSAWVGDRRAARMAGSSPARAPMMTVAAIPPVQAWGGMTTASPWPRA